LACMDSVTEGGWQHERADVICRCQEDV